MLLWTGRERSALSFINAVGPPQSTTLGLANGDSREVNADPKRVVGWLLTILVPLGGGIAIIFLALRTPPEILERIIEKQFAVVIGLPLAAALAAFIVVALRHAEGPMKFKALGFEFEGASGQVILWVVCFLAIAIAIRLLWSSA